MLNSKTITFSRRYLKALRICLKGNSRQGVGAADGLGCDAIGLGLETIDLARIHEHALTTLTPVNCSVTKLEELRDQSTPFFLKALAPSDEGSGRLKREVAKRHSAEAALIASEKHHRLLLKQSHDMEQRLRHLSHQVLSAQEEERKLISRELHDQIAQMLVGINAHLATLKNAAALSGISLNRTIRNTQRMVEKSVDLVHRFARELRPSILDDLGLIPALQSYLKSFSARTGVLVHFTVFAAVEQLNGDKRTVLYRVAQEALTNVGQHAKATHITLTIAKVSDGVEMHIHDNGLSFDVDRTLLSRKNKRLGLIGMRERVEMVGGRFSVTSAPGKGTTIGIQIPFQADKKPSRR